MNRFLASVERRAFLMARSALANEDDALDVVQDAMMSLVKKYASKPEDDWPLLFFKILNNRIRDIIRRRKTKNKYTGWLTAFGKDSEEKDVDPFQQVADETGNNPERKLQNIRSMEALTDALTKLSARQHEAFMLRCWEGFSTRETARVMGCTEGSVKTHYSRAMHFLQSQLEEHKDG